MSQLRHFRPEFDRHGVACLVVTFESLLQAQRYVAEFELDWPLLVDEERTIYRAFAFNPQASLWNLFRPTFWPHYLALVFGGRRLRRPTGDVHQLGGNVLVDPAGVVQLHHSSTNPLDRPSPAQILHVIEETRPSP